jgi:hypothetical protein
MALESAGSEINFHPHIHTICTDGVIMSDGSFSALGNWDAESLTALFEHCVYKFLKAKGLLSDTLIAQLRGYQTSGFSVWVGPEIAADDTEARLFLSQYLTKCPVMLSRMSIERKDGSDVVRYTSDKGSKEFSPLDFMAALSAHIPNKFEQTIRFVGAYSARSRGKRLAVEAQALPEDSSYSPLPAPIVEPPSKRDVSRSWARLIKKIYEVDPLICPKCGSAMKIKAFITNTSEVARVMANLQLPNFHPPPALLTAEKSDPHYWDAA